MTETKKRYELIEVPTQYELAFKDNSDESIMNMNQVILKLLNEFEELKEGLVGSKK